MTRFVLSLALLTLLWAMALESVHPWDLLIGAAVSAALLFALRSFLFTEGIRRPLPGLPRRALALFPFAFAVLLDVLQGTWQVSLIVLRLRPLGRRGILAVPIGERSETGVVVTCLAMTLTPGSFLVDVDRERRLMFFYTVDASDPEAFREQQARMYDRWQRHVFP